MGSAAPQHKNINSAAENVLCPQFAHAADFSPPPTRRGARCAGGVVDK